MHRLDVTCRQWAWGLKAHNYESTAKMKLLPQEIISWSSDLVLCGPERCKHPSKRFFSNVKGPMCRSCLEAGEEFSFCARNCLSHLQHVGARANLPTLHLFVEASWASPISRLHNMSDHSASKRPQSWDTREESHRSPQEWLDREENRVAQ